MSVSTPMVVRVIDVVFGLVLLFLGSWIVLDRSLAETVIFFGFSTGLVLIGVARIAKGVMMSELKRSTRAIQLITGIGLLLLATVVLFFPTLASTILIAVVAVGLLITGVARILVVYSEAEMSQRSRVLHLIVGSIALGVSFLTLIIPGLGFFTLVLLLSIILIVSGAARLTSGVTGEP
ncbi:MAG: DUF308 domain-containing protein [Candidatus Thorarchaeota archaeon]